VTFLFTDLEGSTRLWQDHPDAMQSALARHDATMRGAIAAHGGHVVKTTGDGFHARFELLDLGEHNLRDLARAERVFQVVADGLGRSRGCGRST
jgi:class 3 adenylate cyclase